MAVWVVRAGESPEHEERFFKDHRIYLCMDGVLGDDFTELSDYAGFRKVISNRYEESEDIHIGEMTDAIFEFVMAMRTKDLVIVPRRSSDVLAIGEVASPYGFDPAAPSPFCHLRDVRWLSLNTPRSAFSSEIQGYLARSAALTQIKASSATQEVREVLGLRNEVVLEPMITASANVKERYVTPAAPSQSQGESPNSPLQNAIATSFSSLNDPEHKALTGPSAPCVSEKLCIEAITEMVAQDVAKSGVIPLIIAILEAGGMTVDPLDDVDDMALFTALPGTFGLGGPVTCVYVQPWDTIFNSMALSRFFGILQGNQAEQGLLISWSGFEPQVLRDTKKLGSKIRLWSQGDIVGHFLDQYTALDGRLQQRIPLKRVWIPDNHV